MSLRTCPHCAQLFKDEGCTCPHCGRSSCASTRTSAALLLGLALGGCVGANPQPKYGISLTDADGDGYYDATQGGDDCDDSDPNVHPDADETPGDGVDSNCDGQDDT